MNTKLLITHAFICLYALPTWAQLTSVPLEVRNKADKYIVDQVGENYFKENYSYDDAETKKSTTNLDDIFVNYKYRPLILLDAPDPIVKVRVSNDMVLEHYSYVVQKEGPNIVEPKISKSQALEILKKNYPDVNFVKAHIALGTPNWMNPSMKGWEWRITVSWLKTADSTCGFNQTYALHANTGKFRQGPNVELCE